MAPTGRFALLLALGVVPVVVAGLVGAPAAWLALVGWLLVVVVAASVDLSLAASPRQVALARELPDRVRLGEPVTSVLTVQNLGPRTLRATVRDAWEPSAGVLGRNRSERVIPSGERRRIVLDLEPRRRGDRRTAQVTIRSAGPLGLWSRQATLASPGRVRVLPQESHRRSHHAHDEIEFSGRVFLLEVVAQRQVVLLVRKLRGLHRLREKLDAIAELGAHRRPNRLFKNRQARESPILVEQQ